ncbi:MAG: hypothetical protein HKN29_03050 [Rhodothermales bacterium]|nr:hypothetical protein [Rhodothermales bacterium]
MTDPLVVLATVLSGLVFLYYGLAVFFSEAMLVEFERFGLSKFRRLTGALEILGGAGLLVGLAFPFLTVFAAGGLTLLMALGVITRIRVGDSLVETAPAFILMVLNFGIVLFALRAQPVC